MQLEPQQKEVSSTGVERRGVVEGEENEKKKTSKGEEKKKTNSQRSANTSDREMYHREGSESFGSRRRLGPTDLLYSTLSEGHL